MVKEGFGVEIISFPVPSLIMIEEIGIFFLVWEPNVSIGILIFIGPFAFPVPQLRVTTSHHDTRVAGNTLLRVRTQTIQ
jgi:hypothetical protein